MSIIASMWTLTHKTTTLAHIASTSIPHSLHLSVSVTTRGLYSGIPYTAVAKKCSLEKLYFKRKHNHSSPSVPLLPHCSLTLSFPPSFCFSTLFPVSGFLGSTADGVLHWKSLSFCFVLTYSVTWACGNSID